MSEAVLQFLTHFHTGAGCFHIPTPSETPYEQMVRDYQAGSPRLLKTMKLVLLPGSTESQELERWKDRAKAERARLRRQVRVHHTLNQVRRSSEAKLEALARGTSKDFIALYLQLQSAQLYVDEMQPEGGLHFYPIAQMPQALEDV